MNEVNLAKIILHLETILENKAKIFLWGEKLNEWQIECELLNELKNNIQAFEYIQTSWLRQHGVLANYWQFQKLESKQQITKDQLENDCAKYKNFTQADLTAEILKAVINGAEFARKMMNQIRYDIENIKGKYVDMQKKFPDLFAELLDCATEIEKSAQLTIERAKVCMTEDLQPWMLFAQQLGARYILYAYSQFDPLRANRKRGLCYGFLMAWRTEVMLTGKYLSLPRLDKYTYLQQQNNENIQGELMDISCGTTLELWSAIEKLLLIIDPQTLYGLGVKFTKASNHIMGFRQFLNGEIEFFDANHGLIIFTNNRSFKLWLTEFLIENYCKFTTDFSLWLFDIGVNQKNDIPTIPPIRSDEACKQKLLKTQKNNEFYLFKQAALLLAYYPELRADIQNYQNEIIVQQEDLLYEKIAYHTERFKFNNKKIIELDSDKYSQDNLKNKIISLLDKKIEDLNYFLIQKSENLIYQIQALQVLKFRIQQAPSSSILVMVIDAWLEEEFENNKTFREIVRQNRMFSFGESDVYHFILNLTAHYEINPGYFKLLRIEIVDKMIDFINAFDQFNMDNKCIPIMKEVLVTLAKYNYEDSYHILSNIKIKCDALKKNIGIFASIWPTPDDHMSHSFIKMVNVMELECPVSLLKTRDELTTMIHNLSLMMIEQFDVQPRMLTL